MYSSHEMYLETILDLFKISAFLKPVCFLSEHTARFPSITIRANKDDTAAYILLIFCYKTNSLKYNYTTYFITIQGQTYRSLLRRDYMCVGYNFFLNYFSRLTRYISHSCLDRNRLYTWIKPLLLWQSWLASIKTVWENVQHIWGFLFLLLHIPLGNISSYIR